MKNYFKPLDLIIYGLSLILIIGSFIIFPNKDYLTLAASLVGVTGLLLIAKGNPIGQGLMVVFSIIYGIIAFKSAHYGELISYVGLSGGMAMASLIIWIKHPFKKNIVKINEMTKKDYLIMIGITILITVVFYFILKAFETADLITSTIIIGISFVAVYLTAKRSPFFGIVYVITDCLRILLWCLALKNNPDSFGNIFCFIAFGIQDFYSFVCWIKMKRLQNQTEK